MVVERFDKPGQLTARELQKRKSRSASIMCPPRHCSSLTHGDVVEGVGRLVLEPG